MSDDNSNKPAASAGEAVHASDQEKQKTYHTKATGQALQTVKNRATESELKLFGSCFW
jgi:glutathione S-transferase